MSIAAIILLVLAVAVLGLLWLAGRKPETFAVRRSTRIQSPAEVIFPMIEDFHRWTEWSPYEAYDPAMKRTYSGAGMGVGAVYVWSGNNKVGSGSMEITEAAAPYRLAIKLDFIRPLEAHNTAQFVLKPEGTATEVAWAMRGPNPMLMRVMSLFVDMEDMIGKDFERGLARLKAAAEA